MLNLDESSTNTPLLDPHSSVDFDFILKILIVGDSGAGKTQLFCRFGDETFSSEHRPTQSVEYRHRYIQRNKFRCKIQVWDCISSGSVAVMNSIYKGTNAIVLCIDLTNSSSIDAVGDWVSEIKGYTNDHIHITLVGTKIDSPDRCISYQDAEDLAKSLGLSYSEVSSKTGQGVESVFVNIVSDLQTSALNDTFPRADENKNQLRNAEKDDFNDENDEGGCCSCVLS
jgi:small GTP-binding protein